MKFVIKIRWNCGTERYVTGYGDGRSVKWELDKAALMFDSFERADDICHGLNFNHLSSDLGGFACVVAINDKDTEEYKNMSKEDEQDLENYHMIKLRETIESRGE